MRAESLMSFIPHPRAPTIGSDERFSYDNTVTLSHWFHVSLIPSPSLSFRLCDPEPSLARLDLRSFHNQHISFSLSLSRLLLIPLSSSPAGGMAERGRSTNPPPDSLDSSSFSRGKSRGKLASKDPPIHVPIEFRDTSRLHPVSLDTIKGRNCSIDGKSDVLSRPRWIIVFFKKDYYFRRRRAMTVD